MLLILAWLTAGGAGPAFAQTVRVTTWNLTLLAHAGNTTNDAVEAAAATLKRLAPDVILLQGVRDWTMCARLAQALQPADFRVAVCSAFPVQNNAEHGPGQVAILSRYRAYFTWSERWQAPEEQTSAAGFAFAALDVGNQRIGVLSSQGEPGTNPLRPGQQLLAQVASVKQWEVNRVQTFILGASFAETARAVQVQTLRQLGDAGFLDALAPVALLQRLTLVPRAGRPGEAADYLLVEPNCYPIRSQVSPVALADHYPVTCELELDAAKAAAGWTAWARASELRNQANSRAPQAGTLKALVQTPPWWLAALLGAGIALSVAIGAWLLKGSQVRSKPAALLAEHGESLAPTTSSYTVVMVPSGLLDGGDGPPKALLAASSLQVEPPAASQTSSGSWQQRAIQAEQKVERAHAIIRSGLLPQMRQWLKEKLLRKLVTDRAELMATQQAATRTALNVDERLTRIEKQIQEQNRSYERRIEELTCELMAAKEENRELIRARIAQVRAEMEAAKARVLAELD